MRRRSSSFFSPSLVVEVKALACELPYCRGLPLARFSLSELRREVMAEGLVAQISGATLWRWLSRDALCPWRYRCWLFSRGPQFAAKASRVLDLYGGHREDSPLDQRDFAVCAYEKTSIQARRHRHPARPAVATRPTQVEHECQRAGAWAYLAAWDVNRARLFGQCEKTTGLAPFGRLVAQVISPEPYRYAHRVFWVVDNGSSHRGDKAARRLQAKWPSLVLVHTPLQPVDPTKSRSTSRSSSVKFSPPMTSSR
jgi:hypothetical protein